MAKWSEDMGFADKEAFLNFNRQQRAPFISELLDYDTHLDKE